MKKKTERDHRQFDMGSGSAMVEKSANSFHLNTLI